jgi:uncharacterized membrane protein YfcA
LTFFVYILAAAVGGLLVGILGTGNALVIMPTLAVMFPKVLTGEHALRLATGTTMATMAVGAFFAAAAQHRFGRVNMSLLRLSILPYLFGALAGPWFSLWLPTYVLRVYLALVITIVAIFLIVSDTSKVESDRDISAHQVEIFAVLLVIGVCSSGAGIASGIFAIPYLLRFELPMKTVVGTSTAAAGFYSLFGTVGYVSAGWLEPALPPYSLGFVYLPAFAVMAIVVAIVGPLGVRLTHHVDDVLIQRIFAIFLFFAATAIMLL